MFELFDSVDIPLFGLGIGWVGISDFCCFRSYVQRMVQEDTDSFLCPYHISLDRILGKWVRQN